MGGQFQINTATHGNQDTPTVTGLSDGGFFVAWESSNQDGSSSGIYGQRFDSSGDAVNGEILINDTTRGDQEHPAVTTLSDGSLVLTWQSDNLDGSSSGIAAKHVQIGLSDGYTMTGGSGNDSLIGGALDDSITGLGGNDWLEGNDGSDLFIYSAGDGNDSVFGGTGADWTDTIHLQSAGEFGSDWTVTLDPGASILEQADQFLQLSDDASGIIQFSDGSEIAFQGIERIDW